MFRKSAVFVALTFACALGFVTSGICQCTNQITLVRLTDMKAASKARDFVRFRYSLSASDSLLIRSHEDTETSIGPYDIGFVIARNGNPLQHFSLLPEFEEDSSTLAVTRACSGGSPVYFVTTQRWGDDISPALIFVIAPSADGYDVSTLPTISGGILEVSRADPRHIRTWDSLHEGDCNACETAYRITDYEIRGGKPIRTRRYRTRHVYVSGNFDDRRRIRFIP
jgi:hypothetical protein